MFLRQNELLGSNPSDLPSLFVYLFEILFQHLKLNDQNGILSVKIAHDHMQ